MLGKERAVNKVLSEDMNARVPWRRERLLSNHVPGAPAAVLISCFTPGGYPRSIPRSTDNMNLYTSAALQTLYFALALASAASLWISSSRTCGNGSGGARGIFATVRRTATRGRLERNEDLNPHAGDALSNPTRHLSAARDGENVRCCCFITPWTMGYVVKKCTANRTEIRARCDRQWIP